MARLTRDEVEELREALAVAIARPPEVFQSASEWQRSGFERYSTAQVKRQLEVLVRAGKAKANRNMYAVYYGPVES